MTILFLFAAGLFGGVINTLAGGGTFLTFPALLLVGVPPVLANASNTYACMPGYLSGALGYWKSIAPYKGRLLRYCVIGLIGGALGAEALMRVSDEQFAAIIPWLMLFAVAIYIFGQRINRWVRELARGRRGAATAGAIGLGAVLMGVSFYGGFFNAGLGIILLAYLALEGYDDVHAMNGLKLLVSGLISLIAVVRFGASGSIAWFEGTIMLVGLVIGSYASASFAHLVPARLIRGFVIVYGSALTGYFFWITYLA